jgi:hypothetical protein
MKNILKYMPLVAALALVSCVKDAPSKSEVEAGFDKFTGTMPTVTIASSVSSVDALAGTATVEVTFAGLSDELDSLSIGVLSDTDPTFANASYTKCAKPANGTMTLKAKVSANKHYYLRGVAAFNKGTSYSDVIEVDVPDIPFYAKVDGGKFTCAKVTSGAYGDEYDKMSLLVSVFGEKNDSCRVWGLEIYYNYKGYGQTTKSTMNSAIGLIDNEKSTITIPAYSYLYMATSSAYYYTVGLDAPTYDDAQNFTDMVLTWNENAAALDVKNGWCTLKVAKDTGKSSLDDAYNGGISFIKQ